jgi:hypothetical protein
MASKQPISPVEFRKATGLCQSMVSETFTEAWLMGLIRETKERYWDRTKRVRRPSTKYEAVS